jgi:hypothetical protein
VCTNLGGDPFLNPFVVKGFRLTTELRDWLESRLP